MTDPVPILAKPARMYSLSDVIQAFRRGEFRLALEPQIDLRTRQLLGFECLARWQHPRDGLLPPVQFLQQIETAGLMTGLTLYVLERALHVRRQLRDAGFQGRLSINISSSSLLDWTLSSAVADLARRTGEDLRGIVFELVESAATVNEPIAADTLIELIAQGLELSLDDFWTGYSSLEKPNLDRFCEVKVDRQLTAKLQEDRVALSGISSIANFARNLDWRCIAEGIESRETIEHLLDLGITIGQGYFFARPIREEEVAQWYRDSTQEGCLHAQLWDVHLGPAPLPIFDPPQQQILTASRTPIWAFNIDRLRMEWANPSAVSFWLADSERELLARDFRSDMSTTARERLGAVKSRLRHGHGMTEQWTLFPRDMPKPALCFIEGRRSETGDFLMLVKAFEGFAASSSGLHENLLAHAAPIPILTTSDTGAIRWRNALAVQTFGPQCARFPALFLDPGEGLTFLGCALRDGCASIDAWLQTVSGPSYQRVNAQSFREPGSGLRKLITTHTRISEPRFQPRPIAAALL